MFSACQMGKQTRASFKQKICVSTSKPLELVNLDLFDPSRTKIQGGNYYGFIIVYDFTRFTLSLFLSHKEETSKAFVKFYALVQNQFNFKIITLRTDHDGEFVNYYFEKNCNKNRNP